MTNAPTPRETADHIGEANEKVTADHAELAACPFCGGTATIERFGNTRVSTQYQCDDCGCFLETGEEFHHGRWWNRRPREEALLSEIAALRGERDDYRLRAAELTGELDALKANLGAAREDDLRHLQQATQAERQRDELRKALELAAIRFDEIYEAAEVDDNAYRNEATIHGINGNADVAQSEVRQSLANQGANQ